MTIQENKLHLNFIYKHGFSPLSKLPYHSTFKGESSLGEKMYCPSQFIQSLETSDSIVYRLYIDAFYCYSIKTYMGWRQRNGIREVVYLCL